jgi:hypothetical protein
MRALVRRLRRIEEALLPPPETEASRLYYETMLAISRNRARMRGEPLPDEVPGLEWTQQMSTLGEIIRASRERWRSRSATEEAGASLTASTDRRT